jgi:EAL domain-containing protein (putative c-di-GMP-specific phosphodiesterase class I)
VNRSTWSWSPGTASEARLNEEVTKSALIRSPAEAIATLTALRERGIRLSVDDYGTGQSTLSYLKHLPVHELKVDRSFVTTLANSESDQIMVRSTISLAHELGLEVVAEGIEDRATLDMLRQMGCDYAQGYFISKPIGPNEFLELALNQSQSLRVA